MEAVKTWTSVGVLRDFVGKGENLGTTKPNLAQPMDVGVKLALRNHKTKEVVDGFLSLSLSQALKKKQISLGALLDYPLSKCSDGSYSIHNEQAEINWHDTRTLSIVNLVKVEITDDELIVL